MTEILVTGGCGFIGRHVVHALASRGDRVRVFDLADWNGAASHVDLIQGSILDASAIRRAMVGVRRVYHLAGIPHLWVPRKADFRLVNAVGTELVLRVAAEVGIERVVYCSTESILMRGDGAQEVLGSESPLPPLADMPGPYTRSKHQAEMAAWEAARAGQDVVVVNPTVPLGAGDDNMTPPATMLEHFLHARAPFFLDCVLNLADVRDIAMGIVLAADRGRSGERYILGGENISLGDLLRRLEALTGCRMPKWRIPPPVALATASAAEWLSDRVTRQRPVATREGVRLALRSAPFDSGKAQRELGYQAQPIDAALRQAIEWLSSRKPSLARLGPVSQHQVP